MPRNYSTDRKGIAAVQARLADLELIWRETSTGDFGIDGHIEFLDENSEPTGMMVGVQVKSGQSYFIGETDYRGVLHSKRKTPEVLGALSCARAPHSSPS